MKKLNLILGILAILTFTSCATIFTGTKDVLNFDSSPQGAKVFINGVQICKSTPCSAKLTRSLSEKIAEFKLDGYATKLVVLDRTFNAVSILNIFGLVGWAVDAATGSIMKYDMKTYDIELERKLSSLDTQAIEIDTEAKTVAIYAQQK